MLLAIIVPVIIYIVVTLIVGAAMGLKLDKQGKLIKKKTRYRRKTYDDGFGKYTVDIKEEEYVAVPKKNV